MGGLGGLGGEGGRGGGRRGRGGGGGDGGGQRARGVQLPGELLHRPPVRLVAPEEEAGAGHRDEGVGCGRGGVAGRPGGQADGPPEGKGALQLVCLIQAEKGVAGAAR